MITAIFNPDSSMANAYGLWQWDYGQILRIQGLHLPSMVEIHFSLQETGGTAVMRVGVTKDGVGYRFYKDYTTIRRRIFFRISNDIKTIRKYGVNTDLKVCRGFMSRHGFIKISDSAKFKRKSKYDTAYQIAREVIRNEAKNNVHGNAA